MRLRETQQRDEKALFLPSGTITTLGREALQLFIRQSLIPMIKPGIARTVRPALLLMLALLNLGWLILAAPPVSAEQTGSPNLFAVIAAGSFGQSTVDQPEMDDSPTDTEDMEAIAYPIGIFITSLHDLDVAGGSFGVDYWVWSVHPPELNPLETLEFYNAKEAHADSTRRQSGASGPGRSARSARSCVMIGI